MRRKIPKKTYNKIVRLYAKDYSIQRIAKVCFVSWPTIKNYLEKLGILGKRGVLPARSIHGRPDLEKRIVHGYKKGNSINTLSKRYHLSERSISKYLKHKGVHKADMRYKYDHSKINELIIKGCSYASIARYLGVPYRIFYGYVQYHKFPKPYVRKLSVTDIPEIIQLLNKGKRISYMAQELNISYHTLLSFMKKHQITSPIGRPRKDFILDVDK